MRKVLMICVYVAIFLLANLLVASFGPAVTPFNALFLIAADMVLRDRIQFESGAAWSILACFLAGFATVLIAPGSEMIALASGLSCLLAGSASAIAFKLKSGGFFQKALPANVIAAAVDSIAFPLIAFGSIMPGITAAQFAAKTIGASIILLIIRKLSK
ncbi:hypothetical protein OPT79_68 [Klebsiella phage vB_KpnD_Opt-79]|uniref:VUT family protein n=1 Tax=Escherichia phage vB_EcoD_Sadiya TaxID=2902684 RepID=A0AC61TS57_9CAUD|nr:VUT family protein [Escherichia phage vB_EcoD_Opt-719]UGO52831.1 hypothetical protein OPT79_68 [Klebsiella phage vB_KpnD_Opt-79]UGV22597.1 putative VUT family protein [Escherichia phage vB_ EcoD_Phleasolo]UGV22757.1 VUT family protein [Escherichia phage vB_EcoD_Sadiya]